MELFILLFSILFSIITISELTPLDDALTHSQERLDSTDFQDFKSKGLITISKVNIP